MADDNDKPTFSTDQTHEAPPADTEFEPTADLGGDVEFDSDADDADLDQADDSTADTTTSGAASETESTASGGEAAASGTAQLLKDSAAKLTKTVGDRAKGYAEDGKSRAGGALDELAQMMHDAAGTVEEKVGAQYGQYARTAADTVSGFSESLKSKNVDDLLADATSFVRKSPAIAVGTAAAIGFVLIRLVQSGLNADTDDRA